MGSGGNKPSQISLAETVKQFRVQKLRKQEQKGKGEKAKLHFCLDAARDPKARSLERALLTMVKAEGGEQKHGAAPRGPLEREIGAALAKLQKK